MIFIHIHQVPALGSENFRNLTQVTQQVIGQLGLHAKSAWTYSSSAMFPTTGSAQGARQSSPVYSLFVLLLTSFIPRPDLN